MKNKHLPLIIGISLPIVFIIIISAVIFIPSISIRPQYNFIYTSGNNQYQYNQIYSNTYSVENNQLVLQTVPVQIEQKNNPNIKVIEDSILYLYDVKNNTSHQITFDEAKKYIVDAGPSSPDGYTVKYEYNNSGIFDLFGGSQNNGSGLFIEKDNGKKALTGMTNNNQYSYYGDFKLIGWIK
ncbi:MAG: hypothetical protein WCF92_00385 [bacterium]